MKINLKRVALSLALIAACGLAFNAGAFAGEEAPAKPAVKTEPAKTEAGKSEETVKTATETPACSMMKWMFGEVAKTPGAKPECMKSTMTAWFAGGKDVPLAGMRDALVKDGWTAESTVAFFKAEMAKRAAAGDCSGCDKSKCSDKADCDKSECCGEDKCEGDCPCKGEAAKPKPADGAPAAAGDAAPAGDAGPSSECGKCCGGCDKSKKKEKAAPVGS